MRSKFYLIVLSLFCGSMACKHLTITEDEITLDRNGDTVQVVKKYASKKIKEIVSYRNNMPVNNIGFYETGDTIKNPDVIFTAADSMLFAYLPLNKNIFSANMYLGMDSAKWEQPYYLRINDSLAGKLSNLTRSTGFRLRSELLTDNEFVGVFQCTMGSANGELKYFPFKTKIQAKPQGPDTARADAHQPVEGVSVRRE